MYSLFVIVGQDYETVLQVLEFEPGVTEKEVNINITDDESIETNETFILYLSSGAGVYLSPFTETKITIINDDGKLNCIPQESRYALNYYNNYMHVCCDIRYN